MKFLSLAVLLLGATGAFADWKQESFNGSSFNLYLPKNINTDPTKPSALMITLHGCAQTNDDIKNDGNWVSTADDYNMVVALPKVPNGGKYMGCWDYYGPDHTRTTRDDGFILSLVSNLLARKELNIDPKQVYVSGLSSGGGEAMVLGCLAPDVFAGIGLNAGPTVGTTANDISQAPTNMANYIQICKKLAGINAKDLDTQLTSIIYGNNDFIVNTKHDTNNAEVMSTIYNAKTKTSFDTKKLEGSMTDGTGTMYSDSIGPRISVILNTNLGHNWPAGQGGNGGNFVNKKSINYPRYLTKFLFENNRRTKTNYKPELQINKMSEQDSHLWIAGKLNVNKSLIAQVDAVISEKETSKVLEVVALKINKDNSVEGLSSELANGEYNVDFNLINSTGTIFKKFFRSAWIGEVPSVMAPQLYNVNFATENDCFIIKGQVVNNGVDNVLGVDILLDGQTITRVIPLNTFWDFKNCRISSGTHELKAVAVNEKSLESNASIFNFTIGLNVVTSNLFDHMSAHRLKWEEYGVWYAKYQDHAFTLYKKDNGSWSDQE